MVKSLEPWVPWASFAVLVVSRWSEAYANFPNFLTYSVIVCVRVRACVRACVCCGQNSSSDRRRENNEERTLQTIICSFLAEELNEKQWRVAMQNPHACTLLWSVTIPSVKLYHHNYSRSPVRQLNVHSQLESPLAVSLSVVSWKQRYLWLRTRDVRSSSSSSSTTRLCFFGSPFFSACICWVCLWTSRGIFSGLGFLFPLGRMHFFLECTIQHHRCQWVFFQRRLSTMWIEFCFLSSVFFLTDREKGCCSWGFELLSSKSLSIQIALHKMGVTVHIHWQNIFLCDQFCIEQFGVHFSRFLMILYTYSEVFILVQTSLKWRSPQNVCHTCSHFVA